MIAIGQHLRQCDCGPLMLGGPVSGGFSTKTLLRKSQAASLLPNALIAYSLIPHVRLMQTSRGGLGPGIGFLNCEQARKVEAEAAASAAASRRAAI